MSGRTAGIRLLAICVMAAAGSLDSRVFAQSPAPAELPVPPVSRVPQGDFSPPQVFNLTRPSPVPRAIDEPASLLMPTTAPPEAPTSVRPATAPPPDPAVPDPSKGTSQQTSLQPARPGLEPPIPSQLPFPKPIPPVVLPDGGDVVLPEGTKRQIRFGPRYGKLNDYVIDPIGEDTQRITYTGGLIVNVVTLPDRPGDPVSEVEFATDNAVIWVKGIQRGPNFLGGINTAKADDGTPAKKTSVEFYMCGNVIVRTLSGNSASGPNTITLSTEEVYYDVDKNKAVAINADLETQYIPGADPVHIRGREIWRLGTHEWQAFDTLTFSSKLPADPSLTLTSRDVRMVEQYKQRRNIFGQPYRDFRTGQEEYAQERTITANRNRVRILGVPFLFFPKYDADLSDPAGPLAGFGFRQDGVFGTQLYASWDVYKLLGYRPPPGHRWVVGTDYLSERGFALGTDYTYRNLFGFGPTNYGAITGYVVSDKQIADRLGGFRGPEPINPRTRGRFTWSHTQDIYEFGTEYAQFQGQFAYLSDKNFFEQYYKQRFDIGDNQETFANIYGARGIFAWSALAQANVNRQWVTETEWLPRFDGAVVGMSLLDRFVYTARGSAGYAQLKPSVQFPPAVIPTEQRVDTARADIYQKLSAPLDLGPFRVEPYGLLDLSAYSNDLERATRGRITGAGGTKVSVPFSRIYRGVESELLNVRDLNHKMTIGANYYYAQSNIGLNQLPLLDRLNDDNIDLTQRTYRSTADFYRTNLPNQINTAAAPALAADPVYDAQLYALRRVATNRPETLDTLQVVQLNLNHRLQTKRGPQGNEHTVDWYTLDLSASLFPDKNRDNFGKSAFSFLEYNSIWNVGDRYSITSAGWFDPFDFGARYGNIGLVFNRPDGTNLYLGYRHVDPQGSRAVVANLGYQISRKYSVLLSGSYDFGFQNNVFTALNFNRVGTDMTMSLGFTYNAFINNFGLQFVLVPNIALAGPGGGNRPVTALLSR